MQFILDGREVKAPTWISSLSPGTTIDDLGGRLSQDLIVAGRWPDKFEPIGGPTVDRLLALNITTKPVSETVDSIVGKLLDLSSNAAAMFARAIDDLENPNEEPGTPDTPDAKEIATEAMRWFVDLDESLTTLDAVLLGRVDAILEAHKADQERLAAIFEASQSIDLDSPAAAVTLRQIADEIPVWRSILEEIATG